MKDSVKIRKLIWTRKQSGLKIFRVRNIGTLLLAVLALVAVLPVLFSITGSLMGQNELNDLLGAVLTSDSGSASGQTVNYVSWRVLPVYPTLKSYIKVLLDSPEFFVMFWNSVKISVGVLAGQILVGVPAAWGFARYRFPGKNLLFMVYVALMMMPFQVMMLSNYLVLDQMALLDNLWGIILPAVFSTFPVFIMYRFFESIPEALMESARLDGAGELLIFIKIGIPLGSPGIISAYFLLLYCCGYDSLFQIILTCQKDNYRRDQYKNRYCKSLSGLSHINLWKI